MAVLSVAPAVATAAGMRATPAMTAASLAKAAAAPMPELPPEPFFSDPELAAAQVPHWVGVALACLIMLLAMGYLFLASPEHAAEPASTDSAAATLQRLDARDPATETANATFALASSLSEEEELLEARSNGPQAVPRSGTAPMPAQATAAVATPQTRSKAVAAATPSVQAQSAAPAAAAPRSCQAASLFARPICWLEGASTFWQCTPDGKTWQHDMPGCNRQRIR